MVIFYLFVFFLLNAQTDAASSFEMVTSSAPLKPTEPMIAQMFNRIAGNYDFLNRFLSMRQDVRWRKWLCRHLPFAPQGTLVDVATGTGDVLLAAAKTHPEYSHFLGVDIAASMLSLAEQKVKRAGIAPKTKLSIMSAEDLQLASSSADAITISFGLRNVINKQKALTEFTRVLKPHGRLIILEFFQPTSTLLARLFRFYFHHILPRIGGMFSDRSAYTYLPSSVDSFYSVPELQQLMSDEGLSVVAKKSFLFGGCWLITAVKAQDTNAVSV